MQSKTFRIGDWQVDRAACTVLRDGTQGRLIIEPRAMDVLTTLCRHAGDVLSAEDLLRLCWDGLNVGENQVHKAIAQLRKAFGDDAAEPSYIENIRKRGYRTVAAVSWPQDETDKAAPGSWSDGSPYVGLDPFDTSHARLFFGREGTIARLADAVAAQIARRRALVLVLGPSGSGKTSLIQAGLLPALREGGRTGRLLAATTLDLADIGDVPPATALGGALLDWEIGDKPVLAGRTAEEIGAGLAVGADFGLAAAISASGRFLLFVDRLEALFDGAAIDDARRTDFLAALDQLARTGAVTIVAACRNDFYPFVAREPVLMEGKPDGAHFDVAPPSRAEISQMIRLPAQAAGLSFGTDPETNESLADLLCDAAAQSPDALPLLQYTLQELYFQRSPARELTIDAYRALGGIDGAIGRRAEAALNSLPDAAQAALPRILPLVAQIGADDGLARSRRAPWSALETPEERALVRALVEQRLFVSLGLEGAPYFGVAHEALLRQWPRVVEWIAEHRQALRTRSRLEAAAQQWIAENRRRDLLLPRGKPVEEARALALHQEIHLSPEVASFIDASVRRVKQADRFRLGAAASFAVIAIVAGAMGLLAHRAEGVAEQRSREAEGLMNYMVGDLADKLRPLGRLDLLSGVGEKALSYFGDAKSETFSSAERRSQAKALQTLAEVARAHADPKAAQEALTLARGLLERERTKSGDNSSLLKDLGANAFWQGQMALDQHRLDDAQTAFEDYQRFADRMMTLSPNDTDAWVELSYAFTNIGVVANAKGNHGGAQAAFEKSIALKRQALEKRPTDRDLRNGLANSLSWLGSAYQADGQLPPALDLFNQEQAELEALRAIAPSENKWAFFLVGAKHRRASLLIDLGEDKAAITELQSAQLLAQTLTQQDPSNRLWLRALLNIQSGEGEVLTSLGHPQEALILQTATADRLSQLTKQDISNRDWRVVEESNLLFLGDTLLHLNHSEEARHRLETALNEMRASTSSTNPDADHRLALGLILLSQIKKISGEETTEECQSAIDLLKSIRAKDPTNSHIQDLWVRAHFCLGKGDDVKETVKWLEKINYRRSSYLTFLSKFGQ